MLVVELLKKKITYMWVGFDNSCLSDSFLLGKCWGKEEGGFKIQTPSTKHRGGCRFYLAPTV
jgi:hypothetical protein